MSTAALSTKPITAESFLRGERSAVLNFVEIDRKLNSVYFVKYIFSIVAFI